MRQNPQQVAEARKAQELRDKEARNRKEIAYRHLAANDHFKEFCIELKKEAQLAIEDATKEARKPAKDRNNQHVVDKLREYDAKENAASRVFDEIAIIDKETIKKESSNSTLP